MSFSTAREEPVKSHSFWRLFVNAHNQAYLVSRRR